MFTMQGMDKSRLPWRTWLLPFIIFHLGTHASLYYTITPGTSTFYFPVACGIVLIHWWGPRVLVGLFLNALLSMPLWGLTLKAFYPLYALPEVIEVALSWYLVRKNLAGRTWNPTPRNMILFGIYGILLPGIFMSISLQATLFFTGVAQPDDVIKGALSSLIGDLLGGATVSLPLLIVLSPLLFKKSWSAFRIGIFELKWQWNIPLREKVFLASAFATSLVLSVSLPITQSWYLYAIFLMISSIWYGLEFAIFANTWVLILVLAIPAALGVPWPRDIESLQITGTLLTICFCALVAGSAISVHREKIEALRETELQLKYARDQAEDASLAKSEFLARMSHEIRTPLNSVLGMLELLKETHLSSDQERYLTLFSHAGENLKALINDLLDFSKIEAKALNVENISFNIHSTIRSVFEILQIKAEEKGLTFELKISNQLPPYQMGDPTRLRQILFNLIGNALKFTEEGEVTTEVLLTDEKPKRILIEIRDSGIGIPRDKQQKLFNPFFQGDSSITRRYGGTGLGLVISKNLVEIMGGELEMRSLAGRGTTFLVYLPHQPDLKPQTEIQSPQPFQWPARLNKDRYHILLVDDSEDNRVLMIHYLKNLPFTCDEAVNGQEAIDLYIKNDYDLIFMDMQMPVLSGYKATEAIRHIEISDGKVHVPIVALTATAVIEDLNRALKSGCDRYAVKPVKKSEILEILAQSLTTNEPSKTAHKEPPESMI